MRRLWTVLAALATLSLTNCGYNAIQTNDEQVKSGWSEVVNQYQRRADLVPNLVNSVKGFAQQEKDVLLGVTNARAKVGSIQATPELINDPGAFAKFQAAQGELTSALSRLLVVTENYPQLKSDALFRDLMAQLEGTENRITVARNRYIKAVQDYNVTIRSFPSNIRSGLRKHGRSGARRSMTGLCSSSPRTIASFASRSATVLKGRLMTLPPSGSSTKSSPPNSGMAISPAEFRRA